MTGIDFLKPYKIEDEIFSLSSGDQVSIQKYFLKLDRWDGKALAFDFGRKPIVDFDGEACFAELAILRLFQQYGWQGAWVETYGGKHYLNSMPSGWKMVSDAEIPTGKVELINKIQKAGGTSACFDVVAWLDDRVLFIEAKRLKKDRLTEAQKKFILGAISCGVLISDFAIIEWDIT